MTYPQSKNLSGMDVLAHEQIRKERIKDEINACVQGYYEGVNWGGIRHATRLVSTICAPQPSKSYAQRKEQMCISTVDQCPFGFTDQTSNNL